MTYEQALEKFGLPASSAYREEIRKLLIEETEKERRGESGEEMLRTLCVQLFSLGIPEDALLIWDAKQSSFDAGNGLDIQLLCGAGLSATKDFLAGASAPAAAAALKRLSESETIGDFADWTPQSTIEEYRYYYGL